MGSEYSVFKKIHMPLWHYYFSNTPKFKFKFLSLIKYQSLQTVEIQHQNKMKIEKVLTAVVL